METERRTFLLSIGALSVLGIAPPSLLAMPSQPAPASLRDAFKACLKDWLYLYDADAGNQGELQLVGVADKGSSDSLEQFDLILSSRPGALELPDGYYLISGNLQDLFIQHSHSKAGKNFYRAQFAVLR